MLGYVALPTFGEVDDNAPAEQAFCDLWTIETKFPNSFSLPCSSSATSKTGPPGAPCETASVTENRMPLAPLCSPRRAQALSYVSVLFRFKRREVDFLLPSGHAAGAPKRAIDWPWSGLSIGGIV